MYVMLGAREAKTQPFTHEECDLCPANVGVRRLVAPEAAKEA